VTTPKTTPRSGPEAPRRNRVTPFSELVAVPERGLVYGNRGVLHDSHGEIRRRAGTARWISCRLSFKGRRRAPLMQPGRFTELFFLDEATAFAAGHRPCALCRREDYRRFLALTGTRRADELDARLQAERLTYQGAQRHHVAAFANLPDGAFVLRDDAAWLVHGGTLHRWTPGGYTDALPLPDGAADVITPETMIEVLEATWSGAVPLLHPSAERHINASYRRSCTRACQAAAPAQSCG
jgi:hypothetical protein